MQASLRYDLIYNDSGYVNKRTTGKYNTEHLPKMKGKTGVIPAFT